MLIKRARMRCRHALACLAVAGSLGAAGVPAASAQGLFEALFGTRFQEPPPPVYQPPRYYPDSAYDPLDQRRARSAQPPRRLREPAARGRTDPRSAERRLQRARPDRANGDTKLERPVMAEPAKPATYVAPQVMPGPLGRFLRDPTLRAGDVVATTEGLMVFRGSRGTRHAEKDFVPLSRAGSMVAREARTELAKLDRALDQEPAEAAPARAAPIVAQDSTRTAGR